MFRAIYIALCVLFLSACSADRMVLSLHTSNVINPDDQHRALVLYLKIFQLSSLKSFQDQSVTALWQLTQGPEILAVDTVCVKNNDTKTVSIDLDPRTEFIGVVADFRQSAAAQTLVIPLKGNNFSTNPLSILIQNNQLELGGS